MPKWTTEQQEAIDKENTNIIVSAGAGSGKTAVLSERVLRKLKSGVNIDELLIMTFTKAAAREMRERIRKKIKKEDSLRRQLDLIDVSYITTFDSFALSIVKKYHYLLNVSRDINVIDANIIMIKKEEILDSIFADLYKKNDDNFTKLINDFCIKDDTDIKSQLLVINNRLDMKLDKINYLENYMNNYYSDDKINKDIDLYVMFLKKKISELELDINDIANYVDGEYMNLLSLALDSLFNSTNYLDIKLNSVISLPRLPKGSSEEVKNLKSGLDKKIKAINKLCRYEDCDYIKKSIVITKSYVKVIIDILLELDKKIMDYKKLYDAYEFNDIAKLSIKVIKEHEDIRLELRDKFNEIMIDEYQDTNDLQEGFVNLISNNNVYMVGDIKQSIYRFRNANPYIFKNKYDNYSNSNGGYKIDLNKNFRSRFEVLDNINTIFNLIMDDNIGGANYISEHQMVFGNNTYNEEGKTDHDNNLDVLLYDYQNSEYSRDEIECFIIADDIINKVNEGYLVFDKDDWILRPISYNDFVILLDRGTKFDLFKKIFEYKGIPLSVLKEEKMNNSIDIYVINNLIKLIIKIKKKEYDKEFRYLYMSIARSFLVNIDDNTIFECFNDNSFYDTLIFRLCNEIAMEIDIINGRELIDRIIDKFNYYDKLISIGNVDAGIIRLENLLEISDNLDVLSYTVYDFSDYLDKMIKEDYQINYTVNDDSDDSVKIMTIHKSKGLEYHVCYFANLYNNFNIRELNDRFMYDNKYGIVVPFFDEGIDSTIYKELVRDNYIKEEISEKIRLFYVALTRAKEKMIMVLPNNENEFRTNKLVISDVIRNKYRKLSDIMYSCMFKLDKYIKQIDLNKIDISKDYDIIKEINYEKSINSNLDKLVVKDVSLDIKEIQESSFSKKTNKLFSKEEKNNIELGLKMHEALENYNYNGNNNIDDKFIENKINEFLSCDIVKNIKDAKIFREYEFIYDEEDIEYHGIIDLMLEYKDRIDIIDYKLKSIDDDNYIKQLNGYREFIKKKSNKPINIYLYSIIDNRFKEI